MPGPIAGPSASPALHLAVRSSYRALLREVRILPDPKAGAYCRERWRLLADKARRPELPVQRGTAYLSSLRRELRRIERVNAGDIKAYERLLSLTFGRTGKRRRDLMRPLLTDYPPPLHPSRHIHRAAPPPLPAPLARLIAAQHISLSPSTPRTALAPLKEAPRVNRAWREMWAGLRKVGVPLEARDGVPAGKLGAQAATTSDMKGPRPPRVDGGRLAQAVRDMLERGEAERAQCAVPRRARQAMEARGEAPPPLPEVQVPSQLAGKGQAVRKSGLTPRLVNRAYRRLQAELAKI